MPQVDEQLRAASVIRPVVEDDVQALYELAGNRVWWSRVLAFGTPSPHTFTAVLLHDTLVQYVIEHDGAMVGACALYDHDDGSSTAWVDVIVGPGAAPGTAERAVSFIVEQGFANWGLRKLYCASDSSVPPPFSGLACPTSVEATTIDASFHDGRYWDGVVGAVYRTDWEQLTR
jgi:RimJ/RimL family protein N-acetyltransferase